MRRVVLKHLVSPGRHEFVGYSNLKFLSVEMQKNHPVIWFEVDEGTKTIFNFDEPQKTEGNVYRTLAVLTGEPFEKPDDMVFLGSAVSDHFVVHVYVEKKHVSDHNH